jgi:beta-lactamase superfamily II metal-dependent hydrolase
VKRNWGRLTGLPGPVAFTHRPVGRNLSRDQEDRVQGVFGNNAKLLILRDKTKSKTEAGQKYWSVFLLLRFGDASMLFTGDVLASYEKNIAPRIQNIVPRVHLLKVTHHGAESGTCKKFLQATLPAIAISSSDSDGGHRLEKKVRDRLKKIAKSAIYTTFKANRRRDVIVRTDGVTRTIDGLTGVVFEVITRKAAIFN